MNWLNVVIMTTSGELAGAFEPAELLPSPDRNLILWVASRQVVGIDSVIPGGDQSGETSSGTSASSLSRSPMSFAIEPSEK